MNEQRSCLVVVHPGSALGSANMNLGKFEARAARAALAFALEQWEGDVVVIHGEMSDELPYYPRLQEAIQGVLERNRASGHHASEVQGDDAQAHNQEAAIDAWLVDQGIIPGAMKFCVTGAWYHPEDGGGCVGSVVDRLRERGHSAEVDASAVEIDLNASEDENEDVAEDAPSSTASGPEWPDQLDELLERAHDRGWSGWGGECFAHALVLATALWPDREIQFQGAFNRAFYEKGRAVGHVAIEVSLDGEAVYLDADGHPKTWDLIESWGMLDADDPDYQEIAEDLGVDWDDEVANDVIKVTMTAEDLRRWVSPESLEQAQQAFAPSPPKPVRGRRAARRGAR